MNIIRYIQITLKFIMSLQLFVFHPDVGVSSDRQGSQMTHEFCE